MLAPWCESVSAFLNGQRGEEHCDPGNGFVSRICDGTIRTRHSDEQRWRYDAGRSLRAREPPRPIDDQFDEYDHYYCESVWVSRRLYSLEVRMEHGKRETRTKEVSV